MARTNFDTEVYTHEGFPELLLKVGNIYLVKGYLVHAWEIAQKYWLEFGAVPRSKWPDELNVLIDTGFARFEPRPEGDFVYVSGSRERFDFLHARVEAGKKGGAKKAANARQLKASDKPPKQKLATASKTQQTKQSLTNLPSVSGSYSVSVSGSISGSGTGSEIEDIGAGAKKPPSAPAAAAHGSKAAHLIVGYKARFKSRYGVYPDIDGKESGQAVTAVQNLTLTEIDRRLDAFFAMPDAILERQKHPLGQFLLKKNEIKVFAETGNFTTQRQAQASDAVASNLALLKKYQGGGQ